MTTPILGLTELSNTSGERSTLVDSYRVLDGMWGKVAAANINISSSPTSPADGTGVLVGSSPTGDFVGFEGHLALFIGAGWHFISPTKLGFVQTESGPYQPNVGLDGWTPLTIPAGSVLTTKGDLLAFGTGDTRLPVGADGQVLTANSSEALGVEWTNSGGGASSLAVQSNGVEVDPSVSQINFTGGVVSLTAPGEVAVNLGGGSAGGRELLTAPRTYFVRTDGSDSNDGLTNTAGGAFLTIQQAVNTVAALDTGIHDVTIKLAESSTYDAGTASLELKEPLGAGRLTIEGSTPTASDTIITNDGSLPTVIKESGRGLTRLKSLQILVKGTAGRLSVENATLEIENVHIKRDSGSTASTGILVSDATVKVLGGYTIEGDFTYALNVNLNGIITAKDTTITTLGSPTWGLAYILGRFGSYVNFQNATFVGSASGDRANLAQGAFVRFNSGVTLPGNANGPVDSTSYFGVL